jgi:hypothetical protein
MQGVVCFCYLQIEILYMVKNQMFNVKIYKWLKNQKSMR